MRIAYQGVPGAYSQLAAVSHCPGAVTTGRRDFEAVVTDVASGRVERGLLPVANTIVGEVTAAVAAMSRTADLVVLEQFDYRICHCLAALPGADLASIRWVESHPVALAQCARWLSGRRLAPHAVLDTAGAAQAIAADRDWTRAAICNAEAAERYGLTVLARDIADTPDNFTTFVVLARRAAGGIAA